MVRACAFNVLPMAVAALACRPDEPPVAPTPSDTGTPTTGLSGDACPSDRPFEGYGFDPAYAWLTSGDPLRDRIAWLPTVLASDAAAAAAIGTDPELVALADAERADLVAASSCAGDLDCVRAALVWTADQNTVASARLEALFAPSDLFARHLDPSGAFVHDAARPPGERITLAWSATAADLAAAFDVYVAALDVAARAEVVDAAEADGAWFEPLVQVVTGAMVRLGRDEAARYEPLADGENAAAMARMATIDWDEWPFALIVVPGQAADDALTPLSTLSASRADAGALRFQDGLAPFVLTSGGHVHPDQTPFSEAIEMKAWLMDTWDLPEDTILVDPYARHTTTNVRNAARIGLRGGMPPDAPILLTSDPFQVAYILTFVGSRAEDELGYLPWRGMGSLAQEDLCYRAHADVLTLDPSDPLDP